MKHLWILFNFTFVIGNFAFAGLHESRHFFYCDSDDSTKLNEFNSLPEYDPLVIPANHVNSTILRIKTEAGEIVFTGNPYLEEHGSEYRFLGSNENIGFSVVAGSFWEHYETYLINEKTGKIDTLWTDPVFAPSDHLIISPSMPYGLEGIPNGFQVWKLNAANEWIKIYEEDQNEWIPLSIKWVNDNEFIIKTKPVVHYEEINLEADKITKLAYKTYAITANKVSLIKTK